MFGLYDKLLVTVGILPPPTKKKNNDDEGDDWESEEVESGAG